MYFSDASGVTSFQAIGVAITNLTTTGLKSYDGSAVYIKGTGFGKSFYSKNFAKLNNFYRNYTDKFYLQLKCWKSRTSGYDIETYRSLAITSTTFKGFSVDSTSYTQSIELKMSSSSLATPTFSSVTIQCNEDSDYDAATYKAIVDSNSATLTSSSPIKLTSSTLNTESCTFKNCKNSQKGGIIFVGSSSTLSDSSSTFTHNVAYSGGAIYLEKGTISLANSIFYENYATSGGAVEFASESVSTTITGVSFTSNYASATGVVYQLYHLQHLR